MSSQRELIRLSERYRRIIVRWKSMRGLSIGFLLALASALISVLLVRYLSTRGLEDKVELVRIGAVSLPIHILFLPSMGIALLFIFGWIYLVQETAYVRAIPGPTLEEKLLSTRMVKYAALIVAIFALSLFTPYLLGSALFLGLLGTISLFARFLEPYALRAITLMSSFQAFDENSKYLLSLNLAALISVILTLIIARRGRRTLLARRR